MTATLYYFHDPMCSWCWAFRPAYEFIKHNLPDEIGLKKILAGLAPDNDQTMPDEMKNYIQNHWRTIQKQVPGTEFNFEFWEKCKPRRSTYPACRAVIAARIQGEEYDDKMTLAIQQGYYLQARNPSNNETLIKIADEIGLEKNQFTRNLAAEKTDSALRSEIKFSKELGIEALPGLLLECQSGIHPIAIDYRHPMTMLGNVTNCFN